MAQSADSTSSWPGFIAQLNTTFNLVRDAFGYALPGAVFLAIGLINGSYSLCWLECVLLPHRLPPWVAFIAVIAASYAAGNVMAATIYMPFSLAKYIVWMLDRHVIGREVKNTTAGAVDVGGTAIPANETRRVSARLARSLPAGVVPVEAAEGSWRDWLISNPTEVASKTLVMRSQHPELFNTLDRRETLSVMGGSMAVALLSGYYVFCRWHWDFPTIIFWGGLITLAQFLTALSHLRRVLKATWSANVPAQPDLTTPLMNALTNLLGRLPGPPH